jgi:hypothetical protein
MRLIDKLVQDNAPSWEIERALNEILNREAGGEGTRITCFLANKLCEELPEPHKIGVRIITSNGNLSKHVYTYLATGDKPQPGAIVLVPAAWDGPVPGVVQPETPAYVGDLTHILEVIRP